MDHVELVSVTTGDGVTLHGLLASKVVDVPTSTFPIDGAITLHGVGGSFYSGKIFPPLVERLNRCGVSVVMANNRGHDGFYTAARLGRAERLGAAFECVDDCRLDIRSWIEFLQSRGCQRIGLIGHSLGAIKVVYAQAHEQFSEVSAIVSMSAPCLSYSRFQASPKANDFQLDLDQAQQLVDRGAGDELFQTRVPFPMLLAAEAYLDKYGPNERYELLGHAAKLQCPTYFAYGEDELNAPTNAFRDLPLQIKKLEGDANRFEVEVVEGGDHFYSNRQTWIAKKITNWLESGPSE